MQLREYQVEWINQIWAAWNQGNRSVLAQLATGAGKTVCFAVISRYFLEQGKQILIIAHRVELIYQAAEKLAQVTQVPIGIIKHGIEPNNYAMIQVASIQTLATRKILPKNIGLLVIDEAHHASAATYRKLINHYQDAQVLGVTATPQRIDGQGFEDLFNVLVVGESTLDLIRDRYLCQYRLFATQNNIDTYAVHRYGQKYGGDFSSRDLALAVNSQVSVGDIYDNYIKFAIKKQTIIYAASVEHSRAIAQYFSSKGIVAEHLDGRTPAPTRAAILKRFQSKLTQVITNYEILTEGYDCGEIECIYCVRPTLSLTLWLQMIGRGLRISDNNKVLTIIDLTDNWKRHGLPDDFHHWSLKPTSASQNRGAVCCEHCTHVFYKPDSLQPYMAEVDQDGWLIKHYQIPCPACGVICYLTRREDDASSERIYVRLKPGIIPEISEIDLRTNQSIVMAVRAWLRQEKPDANNVYKALFKHFITTLDKFTLGDWREIVKLINKSEENTTKLAWELYQEGRLKYHARVAALIAIEKRNAQVKNQVSSDTIGTSVTGKVQVGNQILQKQYEQQWRNAINSCQETTQEFLMEYTGLFNVQFIGSTNVNISLEVENIPELKTVMRSINESELTSAFGKAFAKKAAVMFRIK
ncbi:type III restriction protein res subunit [Crinalium epipsammum PCC 9333]|uniref:Type III restriction protein res subunit n=1 Tax=Crinalium epipsammum PCC 9333 TaxID=1173022 RepID=K9VVA0_9CYAN|nr:DEAD/DEAH box helicase [Crinalium epipsammum]AFZ11427.1 type III restriction protein res subunit [Crinalium epipsammum PCC 9333]